MYFKSLYILLLTALLTGWAGMSQVWGQGKIEPFLRLGSSSIGLDQAAYTTKSGGFGSQFGLNYLHPINSSLQVGTGLSVNSYSFGLFQANVSSNFPTTLDPLYDSWAYDRSATVTGLDEQIRMREVQIPAFLHYVIGSGDLRPYVRLGVALNVPLSATTQSLSGNVAYTGSGELTAGSGRTFTVEFFDLYKENSGEAVVEFNEGGLATQSQDLLTNSTYFSLMAGAGIQYALSSKLSFQAGLHLNQNTNFSAYNSAEYVVSRSGGLYTSSVGNSSKASTRFIGLHAGLGISFGENEDTGGCKEPLSVPVRFVQQADNRRESNRPDPEFGTVAGEASSLLTFQPARWKVSYDQVSGGLRFCGDDGPASEITVDFKGRNDYLKLDPFASGYRNAANAYEVVMSIPNRKDLTLDIKDADTQSPIFGMQVELSFGSTVVIRDEIDSGDRLPQLYDHPRIPTYQLVITHDCYSSEPIFLTRDDIRKGRKEIRLTSSGKPTELSIPIAGSAPANTRIQGAIVKAGRKTPISGSLVNGQIVLYAGCGEAPEGSFTLQLDKPQGYNLFVGNTRGNWRTSSLEVAMTNGRPSSPVQIEKLPSYNLFYLDISEATNRNLIRNPLMEKVSKLREDGDDFLLFLSNGRTPVTATSGSEYTNLMREFVRQLPETPTASTDRTMMLEQMDISSIRPDRRVVNMHFFVSRSVYESSREQLITQLTDAFKDGAEDLRLFIYTDFEVPASSRLAASRYKVPVTYIRLQE